MAAAPVVSQFLLGFCSLNASKMSLDGFQIVEDDIDVELGKNNGQIERGKTDQCRHNIRSKCSYCLPVDPFDPAYLTEREIKHMSFHSYLKKTTLSMQKGRSSTLSYPLANPICRVKDCTNHKPYPEAICSKCQPDPIILARQEFRHCDNVSFENDQIVDNFLNYWRKSGGCQRIGFLIGRYEAHTDVPLGIKATVSAIFEPPQTSARDKVELTDLTEDGSSDWEKALSLVCSSLDLRVLGWIFTDLIQKDGGKFQYSRNLNESYLVSGEECITAAFLQNRFPNICKYAQEGYFGSKFVTVIVSGDKEENMDFRGYQMTNQACALVRDRWLVPCLGKPDLAYVRDNEKCVPDVKYTEKDQYGNQVSRDARPFPVEYLLVDVPAGLAKQPNFTFNPIRSKQPFPLAYRDAIGEMQNLGSLKSYVEQFGEAEAMQMLTDVNLLYFLVSNSTCTIESESFKALGTALKTADSSGVANWIKDSPDWATVTHLAKETENGGHGSVEGGSGAGGSGGGNSGAGGESGGGGGGWACKHCTFANPSSAGDCQICGLPKNS